MATVNLLLRNVLNFTGLALAVSALLGTPPSHAQNATQAVAPSEKPLGQQRIVIVAPFPPGGPVDLLARILADGLQKKYKQTAVVENLPGAAGNIGMERVKRARESKSDTLNLLVIPAGNLTINPTLMPNFPFNVERDFSPITMLAKAPNALVVNPGLKVRTVQELIALAKAKPASLSYASPGIGSGLHLAGELFKQQTDTDLLHIPYKGTAPAMNDVIGGAVPIMFSNLPAILPHIKSGKLVVLGLTESTRSPAAPEIPTLLEQGVSGVLVTSWYGLMATGGTSSAQIDQLNRDASEILTHPSVREQLKAQGLIEVLNSPQEFGAHIRAETQTWAKIIRARNITAE
jgi:tripartite-type tricarboxylate transporter receptor subunit TctC